MAQGSSEGVSTLPIERENRELVPGTTAIRGSVADALVIKDGNLFFLSQRDGNVPIVHGHGFGLYYNDCRFLNGYELRVGGYGAEVLVQNAERGFVATLGLSNPDLKTGGRHLAKHSLEIRWDRVASAEHCALFDSIALQNLTSEPVRFSLALTFSAAFEDIFAVRGLFQGKRGTLFPPAWDKGVLQFRYAGADAIERELAIHFSSDPDKTRPGIAQFTIELLPKGRQELHVSLRASTSEARTTATNWKRPDRPESRGIFASQSQTRSLEEKTEIQSDSLLLNRVLERSLRDLDMLRSELGNNVTYFAAGVPWFVALFGRDSIITALQTLAYDSSIAEQTIRLLAEFQGKEVNPWREEEPGKILHELRLGEMARLNEIPHTPYYGTVDATPLWLVLIARHAFWTGDIGVFNELRPQIEAALAWIDQYGDADGDGYVAYECKTEKGLANQGWKDSGDAIVNRDGSLAIPPIALIEVQAYVYEAKEGIASLYRRVGEIDRAKELERQAKTLREQVNRDFWLSDGYYALALQDGNRPVAVLSSNAGHALWSGIAEVDQARKVADHLLSKAMFNGWGIRTLSAGSVRYNPLGYHLGTVWPHDNSIIAAGFKRYGFDEAASRILSGLMGAALHFEAGRLPELFGGFPLADYGIPVSYPVACQPQAWSAGAIPYLLTTVFGLEPDGFAKKIRIVRPHLPTNVNRVEVQGLEVGKAKIDLLFERKGDQIAPQVRKISGEMDVIVEQ